MPPNKLLPGVDRSNSDRVAAVINDSHEGIYKGSKVWYQMDPQTWVLGELKTAPDVHKVSITRDDNNKTLHVEPNKLVPANPKLQEGIPDLTHLSYLNEPAILYNLQHRYSLDDIYTFAGPVLIALNPCKNLPLYTPAVANAYKAGAKDIVNNLPPHIYLVAANAFRKMLRERQNQSLIVNGESGAGKTETTKKAMQYFATLAGGTGVEDQVLETNPILEAFGNAKTLRNHNSSRFGKLIQIHFNQSNHICGACIKTYLLEKSRVVYQLQGERSYHIFYQLVRGASPQERSEFRLPASPKGFKFLVQSGCIDIDGVDDAKEFAHVRAALTHVGISEEAQHALFRLLSGILWLGNLEFKANHADKNNDSTLVKDTEALAAVCSLLGLEREALCTALTRKRIITPSEVIVKLLNVDESRDNRDALAKSLYAALFNWIVDQINIKLDTGKKTSGLFIAILDIYGFEQFTRNSFEQLCINYANERLQQQFTRHLFTLEQQEYDSEAIDWTKVEFIDNQECVDVIEMQPPKGLGVLAVLDAQCKFPKATDETFVMTLKDALTGASHFALSPRNPRDFVIVHYAGQVQYDSAGFLDKNKDTLNIDLMELLYSASHPLVPQLGAAIRDELENKRGGQTVGGRFSGQLRELIADLDTTGLHFVRCIKPNAALQPNHFDAPMTLHQLRCCGVLEVARIARAGFPTRYTHAQFAERYALLLPAAEQQELQSALQSAESALAACKKLIEKFALSATQYQVGRTKIFFRPGVLGYVEDRWARMQSSTLKIQATWRMYRKRSRYLSLRRAAVVFQSVFRSKREHAQYKELLRRLHAAIVIQREWRRHVAHTKYLSLKRAAVTIQLAMRWFRFRQRVQARVDERERRELLARIENDTFVSIRKQYGVEMDEVRQALAAWRSAKEAPPQGQGLQQPGAGVGAPPAAAVAAAAAATDGGHQHLNGGPGYVPRSLPDGAAGASSASAPGTAPAAAPWGSSNGGAVAGAASAGGAGPLARGLSDRFEVAKELSSMVERLQLENLKLQKQLQLERSLKDRYQHKYEEQNVNWLEQIRVLQEYIQQVRLAYGDHKLPPLPVRLTAASLPAGVRGSANGSPAIAAAVAAVEDAAASSAAAAAAASATVTHAGSIKRSPWASVEGDKVGQQPAAAPTQQQPAATASTSAASAAPSALYHMAADAAGADGFEPEAATQPSGSDQATTRGQRLSSGSGVGSSSNRQRGGVLTPNLDASAYMLHGDDEDELQQYRRSDAFRHSGSDTQEQRAVPELSTSTQHPMQPSSSAAGLLAAAAAQLSREVNSNPSLPSSSINSHDAWPRQLPPPQPPQPQSASQKYVSQLKGELDRVSQVLVDDVDFISEVKQGLVAVQGMDPGYELQKLKKKFDFWKREFKEKLKTAEEVLRDIDRMGGTRPSPHTAVAYQGSAHQPQQRANGSATGPLAPPPYPGNYDLPPPGPAPKKKSGFMNMLFKS